MRGRILKAVAAAHVGRMARLDYHFAELRRLWDDPATTPIMREMLRILSDAKDTDRDNTALAYIEAQKAALFERFHSRNATINAGIQEQNRSELQPLLQAAGLQAIKGQISSARYSYQELLGLDPQWPDALEDYAWFLFDQSDWHSTTGPITAIFSDGEQCLAQAQSFHDLDPTQPRAQQLLKAAHDRLSDIFTVQGRAGDHEKVLQHRQQSLAIAEALYETTPNFPNAAHDLSESLNKLGELLRYHGGPHGPEDALKYYSRDLEMYEKRLAANPNSADAAHDVFASLIRLGIFFANLGRTGGTDEALNQWARSMELADKVLAANPGSAQAATDVEVSLEKLGGHLRYHSGPFSTVGAAAALKYFTRQIEKQEKLLAATPDSVQAMHDVLESQKEIGDFLAKQGQPGDVDAAIKPYTRSIELAEKVLAAKPDSADAARDVFRNLYRLGDLLAQHGGHGGTEAALKYYTRELEMRQRLFAAHPNSAQAASDLSQSLIFVGNFLHWRGQTGDAEASMMYFTRDLEVKEKLLASNPNSFDAARDLCETLNVMGDLLVERDMPGGFEASLKFYARSLEIAEKLLAAYPDSAKAANDVSISLSKLGDLRAKRGDMDFAVKHYTRRLELAEKQMAANPHSAEAAREVWVSCWKLAEHSEKSAKGDAKAWWKRAYEILNGTAQKGMFLSAQDKKDLETLRVKVGGK